MELQPTSIETVETETCDGETNVLAQTATFDLPTPAMLYTRTVPIEILQAQFLGGDDLIAAPSVALTLDFNCN